MLTGEVKDELTKCLQAYLAEFQKRRAKVTDEDVKNFMAVRKMDPFPSAWKEEMDRRAAEQAKKDADKKKLKEEARAKQQAEEKVAAEKKAEKKKKDAEKKQAAKDFAIKKKAEEEAKKKAQQ